MLDTVMYSEPDVTNYITTHFVAYNASMADRASWPLFRQNHVIWTPSVGFSDRNGSMHHLSVGFLPASDFLTTLMIGRARCLMAWTKNAEAAHVLEEAIEVDNSVTPEALFWLSITYFLERRDNTRMFEVWDTLIERYPDSPWARRTYRRYEGK